MTWKSERSWEQLDPGVYITAPRDNGPDRIVYAEEGDVQLSPEDADFICNAVNEVERLRGFSETSLTNSLGLQTLQSRIDKALALPCIRGECDCDAYADCFLAIRAALLGKKDQ
jgi:hypothetical protein